MSSLNVSALVLALVGALPAQTVTWVNWTPAAAPSPRSAMGMAYDGARLSTVLFGGMTRRPSP